MRILQSPAGTRQQPRTPYNPGGFAPIDLASLEKAV
jgi:hypothetical protein